MRDIGEVVIASGGAAGCAVAYYLGQAGIKATLIEREAIGMQASGYSAGGINPLQGALACDTVLPGHGSVGARR